MKIAFVGHEFHRKTRSSAFFLDILRGLGEVSEFYANPDGPPAVNDGVIQALANAPFDRYVFWQTEMIADRLLPLELGPTFIVPMYDSAIYRQPEYWLRFVKCRFLSFSRAHHETLQRLGCASACFQYFPDPGPEVDRGGAAIARDAFFWRRRPRGKLNTGLVLALCGGLGIGRLHIHDAPDFEHERVSDAALQASTLVQLSFSRWFDARAEYDRVAGEPLFFFAPRAVEGIGMAVVEAMGRGQIVVAPDRPTANEYLAHGQSGLLYDLEGDSPFAWLPELDDRSLLDISRSARRRAVNGRRSWEADIDRVASLIADDGRRWPTTDRSAHYGRAIRGAARARAMR